MVPATVVVVIAPIIACAADCRSTPGAGSLLRWPGGDGRPDAGQGVHRGQGAAVRDPRPLRPRRLARWLAGRVVAAGGRDPDVHRVRRRRGRGMGGRARRRGAVEPRAGSQRRRRRGRATIAGKGFEARHHRPQRPPVGDGPRTARGPRHHPDRPRSSPRRHERHRHARPRRAPRRRTAAGRSSATSLRRGRRACASRVRPDPRLALDVDTPADLTHPALLPHLPTWLRTNLDNLR